jgi:Zn finger protein HypA/HybF involved in hydrogenase expression
MIFDTNRSFDSLLREGIAAVQRGNKNLAWSLLTQAARMDPSDANPWLWLAKTTDEQDEKRDYLEQALAADPENPLARRGLDWINGKHAESGEVFLPDRFKQPQGSGEPVNAQVMETFICPGCGGRQVYIIQESELVCESCGLNQAVDQLASVDDEKYIGYVLPTERGHRWAVSQQRMACERCGAHSLWPAGQVAVACPFCGSHQLIVSDETKELVDPQAIVIMQIDEKKVLDQAIGWLRSGWIAPDDLKDAAGSVHLRPAYYPFWTFDGTLELQWSCEVNEGSANQPRWYVRKGVEYEIFDDVLVPGLRSMEVIHLEDLGKYDLKEMVAFKSEFLAGWPALTYDRSLAQAALKAREKVVQGVRRGLSVRILPGQQVRDLRTGTLKWRGMAFRHVLLPVWVGGYHYKGVSYRVLINGQTGTVAGDKPRDTIKLAGIIASILATLIVLGLLGAYIASVMGWLSL